MNISSVSNQYYYNLFSQFSNTTDSLSALSDETSMAQLLSGSSNSIYDNDSEQSFQSSFEELMMGGQFNQMIMQLASVGYQDNSATAVDKSSASSDGESVSQLFEQLKEALESLTSASDTESGQVSDEDLLKIVTELKDKLNNMPPPPPPRRAGGDSSSDGPEAIKKLLEELEAALEKKLDGTDTTATIGITDSDDSSTVLDSSSVSESDIAALVAKLSDKLDDMPTHKNRSGNVDSDFSRKLMQSVLASYNQNSAQSLFSSTSNITA